MTKEEIKNLIRDVEKVIDTHCDSRKALVEDVLEKIGSRYFTCSASTKKEYHSCEPGGLLKHSLNVIDVMFKLNVPVYQCNPESIVITGLFHDLGKIGTVTNVDTGEGLPFYVDEESDWHRDKLGQLYKKNPEIEDYLTHSLRSLRILTQFNFPLTDDEFVAILAHDGYFEEQNRSLDIMRCKMPLLKLIQAADQMATLHEKELYNNG